MRSSDRSLALALAIGCLVAACERDMMDQPRYEWLSPSARWSDGTSARPIPKGTIARDSEELEPLNGENPIEWTAASLQRGRERFEIYCAPCHGAVGDGQGMIVQRGFQRPPSLHEERLRAAPEQHFYEVITHGFGAMGEYGSDVGGRDRWHIAAYIRALQRSQRATLADVPASELAALRGAR